MMMCCGLEVEAGWKYCPICGNGLVGNSIYAHACSSIFNTLPEFQSAQALASVFASDELHLLRYSLPDGRSVAERAQAVSNFLFNRDGNGNRFIYAFIEELKRRYEGKWEYRELCKLKEYLWRNDGLL